MATNPSLTELIVLTRHYLDSSLDPTTTHFYATQLISLLVSSRTPLPVVQVGEILLLVCQTFDCSPHGSGPGLARIHLLEKLFGAEPEPERMSAESSLSTEATERGGAVEDGGVVLPIIRVGVFGKRLVGKHFHPSLLHNTLGISFWDLSSQTRSCLLSYFCSDLLRLGDSVSLRRARKILVRRRGAEPEGLSVRCLLTLGEICLQLGDRHGARDIFVDVLQKEPTCVGALIRLERLGLCGKRELASILGEWIAGGRAESQSKSQLPTGFVMGMLLDGLVQNDLLSEVRPRSRNVSGDVEMDLDELEEEGETNLDSVRDVRRHVRGRTTCGLEMRLRGFKHRFPEIEQTIYFQLERAKALYRTMHYRDSYAITRVLASPMIQDDSLTSVEDFGLLNTLQLYNLDEAAEAVVLHVNICLSLGDRKSELFQIAHQLLEFSDDHHVTFYGLGAYYYLLGTFPDRTERFLRRAVTICPRFADGWILLGHHYSRTRDSDSSVSCYRTAQAIRPNDAWPFLYLGMEYNRIYLPVKADSLLARAIQLTGRQMLWKNPMLLHEIGVVQFRSGRLRNAAEVFERVVILREVDDPLQGVEDQFWHVVYFNLATCYRKLERYGLAVDQFENSLQLNRSDASVYVGLGLTFHRMGQLDNAVENYHKALHLMNSEILESSNSKYVCAELLASALKAVTDAGIPGL